MCRMSSGIKKRNNFENIGKSGGKLFRRPNIKQTHNRNTGNNYGFAQMHRRFGYKMASGLFHKKDGYFGRKVCSGDKLKERNCLHYFGSLRLLPPMSLLEAPPQEPASNVQFSFNKDQLCVLFDHAEVCYLQVSVILRLLQKIIEMYIII
ncbi:hypothetical protein Q1695_015768 [Nippostrongylus brasiliensis]|nr:hypothetical protein Q1695_015768 [Nippostrongylus brasiliensis]